MKIANAAKSIQSGIPIVYPPVTAESYVLISSGLSASSGSISTEPKKMKIERRVILIGTFHHQSKFLRESSLLILLSCSISQNITPQKKVGRCYLTAVSNSLVFGTVYMD